MTRVREDEEDYGEAARQARPAPSAEAGGVSGVTTDRFARAAAESCQGSAGLPVGVQVVALPYEDEVSMGVMAQLDSQIKFWADERNRPAMQG